MNSEKVKEIRIALCKKCDLSYMVNGRLKVVTNEDILTLINELESENEKIKTIGLNEDITVREWLQQNQQLKDQIAELEKENAKLLDSVETVQNNRCTTKCELTEKQLKQFAERLKEISCEMFLKEQLHRCIDETLKEFI